MLTVKKEEEEEEAEEAEAEEWTTKQEHAGGHDFVLKEPGLLALDNFETEFSSTLQDVMACELYFDPKRVGSNELCRIHHAMARTSRPMACLTVRQRFDMALDQKIKVFVQGSKMRAGGDVPRLAPHFRLSPTLLHQIE